MKELLLDTLDSPIGTVLIVADGEQLCALDFADCEQRMMTLLRRHYGPVHLVPTADPAGFSSRVRAYFAGDYQSLDTIPVCTGGTDFQQRVWTALRAIRPGSPDSAPMAQPRESMNRRFTSWTVRSGRSSKRSR